MKSIEVTNQKEIVLPLFIDAEQFQEVSDIEFLAPASTNNVILVTSDGQIIKKVSLFGCW